MEHPSLWIGRRRPRLPALRLSPPIRSTPVTALRNFERGATQPIRSILAAIRSALESAGVEFIEENGGGRGVRLKKP